jgi:DNA-binding response OmpR family regulator
MLDLEKNWPACRPRLLIVRERLSDAPWMESVAQQCQCSEPAAAPSDGEIDLVLLDGGRSWVDTWLRRPAIEIAQAGLLVVLNPWSAGAAADLLRQVADDVVDRSIDGLELCARVHAILRRIRAAGGGSGDLPVRMRRAERKLLEYLRACPGRVVTQNEILDNVFRGVHASGTALVRVHVSRLRRRLGSLGSLASLRTVRGVGYVLDVEGRPESTASLPR